jgi:CRP/FNR family transcriptional regulator
MTKNTPQGTETTVELVGPGQCIGVLAAIEGRSMPLNAAAITPTWHLKVPTRSLLELYEQVSALKDQVVKSIGPRLRKAHEMMSRLSSGTVEERLAAVLFILADSYGLKSSDGVRINVPLTRQDLSEMAGTTVETAIRVMSKWQKEGVVSTEHQMITICKSSELENCLSKI